MQLLKPATFGEFRHATEAFLLEHEAEHGLIYGIAGTMAPPDAYCAAILDGNRVVAAAIRTIAKMVISREDAPGAMAMLAADAMKDPNLHGLIGPAPSLRAFAAATGRKWISGQGSTIYECRVVARRRSARGQRHVAMTADVALLAEWLVAFHDEALHQRIEHTDAAAAADRYIESGAMHVWFVDGSPVACAAALAPTPHGIRIGAVFTPPDLRGRGYASALVADLTQDQLDRGKTFAYLYADRTNQTSNSIYQKIGYRRLADSDDLWLA